MVTDDFEWDDAKAAGNATKHGVTFGEAATAFADPLAVCGPDPDHSDDEDRFVLVGESDRRRLVRVSYTERADGDGAGRVRIISARLLTRSQEEGFRDGTYP